MVLLPSNSHWTKHDPIFRQTSEIKYLCHAISYFFPNIWLYVNNLFNDLIIFTENIQQNWPSVLSSFQRKWMFGLMGVVHLVACLSLKWHLASSKFLMRVPIFLLSDFSLAPSPPFQGPGITNRSQECPTFFTWAHWVQNGHVDTKWAI